MTLAIRPCDLFLLFPENWGGAYDDSAVKSMTGQRFKRALHNR